MYQYQYCIVLLYSFVVQWYEVNISEYCASEWNKMTDFLPKSSKYARSEYVEELESMTQSY